MARLVGLPFANSFSFGRPSSAPARDASSALIDVAPDEARFDHDENGARLGLLVELGAMLGQADRLVTVDNGWADGIDTGTVLVEWADASGAVLRRASYTRQLKATADAALLTIGHLRLVAAVAGFIPRQARADGSLYVRYADRSWELGAALVDGDGVALADSEDRLLIESS